MEALVGVILTVNEATARDGEDAFSNRPPRYPANVRPLLVGWRGCLSQKSLPLMPSTA